MTGRKKVAKEQEEKIRREDMQKAILANAQTLAEEMNIRMFLEAKNGEMIFVEQISVTDIQFPEKKRKYLFWKIKAWLQKVWRKLRFFR